MDSISIVCSGNYHRINYFLGEELRKKGFKVNYLSMNFKSYEFFKEKGIDSLYLYSNFNEVFKQTNNSELNNLNWSIYRSLKADKSHWIKKNAKYQEKCALTFLKIFESWKLDINNNIFFPIIESMDSFLLYEFSKYNGKKTFIYCHGRLIDYSFFSDSHNETLPIYRKIIPITDENSKKSIELLKELKSAKNNLNYNTQAENYEVNMNEIHKENKLYKFWLVRILKNMYYQSTLERHNQMFSYVTKFLVAIESFLVPVQKKLHILFENTYLNPIKSYNYSYDFFALHFSPESSINTPNPEFIDQLKAIDKILLDRTDSSRLLLIKEHPAMYFKRPFNFYKKIKKNPLVRFVSCNSNTKQWYRNAENVYSVTGTILLEAFIDGKSWNMLGNNFLDEVKENDMSVEEFIADVLRISADFVYYSPPSKINKRYLRLFSKKNISTMVDNLIFNLKLSKQ